jgi:hypothetical protein
MRDSNSTGTRGPLDGRGQETAEHERGAAAPALILGLCLVAAALLWSATFYRVKAFDNALVTTGSVRTRITSDAVKWTGAFTRTSTAAALPEGNARMREDLAKVQAYLAQHGVAADGFTVSPIVLEPIWKGQGGGPPEFTLRQTIQIHSRDVESVTRLAKDSSDLMSGGVAFTTLALEYTYTKLADLRIELLAGAVQDARARADAIAQASGGRLGRLKSASAGVVQVLQVNSTEVSDYGAYDTSTIEKDVVATVRASFLLR